MTFYLTLILAILVASSSQCVRNETGSKGRLIGLDAVDGQFPYTVLFEAFHDNFWMQCSGSFIWNAWVLSSAKCVDGMDVGIVYLGTSVLHAEEVAYVVFTSDVYIHPYWDLEIGFDDIALIRIPETDICENIFPIPLPGMDLGSSIIFEGKTAIASGWDDSAPRLQWLRVTIMTQEECAKAYSYAADSIICTYVELLQCSAQDFGGPLLLEDDGVLAGVLSTTIQYNGACVMVYTRISSYLAWIKGITGISY